MLPPINLIKTISWQLSLETCSIKNSKLRVLTDFLSVTEIKIKSQKCILLIQLFNQTIIVACHKMAYYMLYLISLCCSM